MEATLSGLSVHAAELNGKSVYFEVSPLQYGIWTAGKGTFMDEIATMLGLKNVFADASGWAEISEEQVIEANPDIIVTVAMYFGEGQTPVDEILSRAGWQDVTAVKNGDIYNLPNNELSRPGPRIADGAQALFDFIKEVVTQDKAA
jgi:iron complex transport system substrate-binding protein